MPIVVRPEDIRLPKRKLKKDIPYTLGLEEGKRKGKQLKPEGGLLKFTREMVLSLIEGRLGYVPEVVAYKLKRIKNRQFPHALLKKLVVAEDLLHALKE